MPDRLIVRLKPQLSAPSNKCKTQTGMHGSMTNPGLSGGGLAFAWKNLNLNQKGEKVSRRDQYLLLNSLTM